MDEVINLLKSLISQVRAGLGLGININTGLYSYKQRDGFFLSL